ncbi:uncharacterized protein SCHCODRAFT_02241911 [Schizophyllum commune H4-8]|uniref:uncharacterized protein n=1 Tax=Schizophyllum commune (strain H4-8 / FGSC 9210) TaxID=578458 RepID=UPI00215E4FB1|nr:uncharacterized protein SCHCODRAFT_02241911 [Schizophyllum commune H4-8]KAI5895882.1 hypothetical protein SCHCODRAFT_02241911 [Schizophyllum commune H4-8]
MHPKRGPILLPSYLPTPSPPPTTSFTNALRAMPHLTTDPHSPTHVSPTQDRPSLADVAADTKATLAMSLHDIMGGGADFPRGGPSTENLKPSHPSPHSKQRFELEIEPQRSRSMSIDIPPPVYSAVSPEHEHAAARLLEQQLQDAQDAAQLLAQHLHDAEDEALASMHAVQAQAAAAETRAEAAERAVREEKARTADAEERVRKAEARADAAEARMRERESYVEGLEFIVSKLCRSIDEHVTGIPAPAGKRK